MVQLSEQNEKKSLRESLVVWEVDDISDALINRTADLRFDWRKELPVLAINEPHKLSKECIKSLVSQAVVLIGVSVEGANESCVDVVANSEEDLEKFLDCISSNPVASVACCQVLRNNENASTELGLLLESVTYGTLQSGDEFKNWLDARGRRVRPEESEPPVLVNIGIEEVELQLNRPRLKNAFSAAMRDSLVEALRGLATEGDDRPILITGNGSTFCIGGDPAEFGSVENSATAHMIRSVANAAPWLDLLSERITVRINGAAIGAGIELAAFAGRIEASEQAWFSLPEVRMGLIPGAGGTVSISRRIGRQLTARMCLSGERVDAETALNWGLIDGLVDCS